LPAPPGRNSETVDCAELKPIRAIVARVVAIIFDIIRIYEGNVVWVSCCQRECGRKVINE